MSKYFKSGEILKISEDHFINTAAERTSQMISQINLPATKRKVYLVAGAAGVGKSWVCSQLINCSYLASDNFPEMAYIAKILECPLDKPVVFEITVGISTFIKWNSNLFDIYPIVIIEDNEILHQRIVSRGGQITEYASKRNAAMRKRADKYAKFSGTSQEVLDYLTKEFT
jgi:2-phosphoglycerate kinase